MNDNAKKWVEALCSGIYTQGHKRLRTGDTFCCLGVACELFRQETKRGRWNRSDEFVLETNEKQRIILPAPVREWLGLRNATGNIGHLSLMKANGIGFSFTQIADIIERKERNLFQ